jgi:cytochrome P450 family 135
MRGKLGLPKAVDSGPTLPPGPRIHSALQAWEWARSPLPFMERCRRQYGDIFTLRIRHGGTWVLLCHPEDVKRVFTAQPARLGMSEANVLLGPLLGRRSVMLLEEPEHMTRRRLMLPPFHGQRMEGYGEMMAAVARAEVRSWPLQQPIALWPRMQALTLEVILRVVFGAADGERLRGLRERLRELTDWLNSPRRLALLSVLGPRWIEHDRGFRAARGRVEQAVLAEVRRRREAADGEHQDDVLSLLLQARHEDGTPLRDADLRDELITLLSDGPTSTSLAWVFERLLRHPHKLARLREEVSGGDGDAYLEAVIQETMRLCPPVPTVARRLREPMELGGYEIPAGTTVAPCVYLLHRRADVYPNPHSFEPERFLERAPGTYTWIPFGGGARRCLAASFAMQEMKRTIGAVLSEVELRPAQTGSERVARSSIAFAPDRHAVAIATRRDGRPSTPPTPAAGGRNTCPAT